MMKKFLMTLVCLMAVAVTASAQTVYISTGDGAVAYHKSKSCSYLTNSKNVKSVSTSEAKNMGRHECARCYGSAASAASKKTAEKKVTTTKKTVEKKATTAKKTAEKKATTAKKTAEKKATETKTTEKKAAEKKTTTKKTTPARDEKGRFIKKTDSEKTTTTKKTTKKAA